MRGRQGERRGREEEECARRRLDEVSPISSPQACGADSIGRGMGAREQHVVVLFCFDHIKAKSARKTLVELVQEFRVTGVLRRGKPGMSVFVGLFPLC